MQTEKARYTVIMSRDHHQKLKAITDEHIISQAEVIELLLDHMDAKKMDLIFSQFRASKIASRNGNNALLNKLRSLTPEQLMLLDKMTKENN